MTGIIRRIRRRQHPERFQGSLSADHYFEGWYFKIVSRDGSSVFAVIPGVAIDRRHGTSHSFVQFLDGISARYSYLSFPLSEFSAEQDCFHVSVAGSSFSRDGIDLDITHDDATISGALRFSDATPYRTSPWRPGIMSWMTWLPFLECYHGIINLNYTVLGTISVDGTAVDLSGGRGYLEKDWGRSFPSHWIWMQTNHFSRRGDSFVFSLARVPMLFFTMTGFFAVLRIGNRTHTFATHTGARIVERTIGERSVFCEIADHRHVLRIIARKNEDAVCDTAEMKAPRNGEMRGKCAESITSRITLVLRNRRSDAVLFEDTGVFAGLEIMGTEDDL